MSAALCYSPQMLGAALGVTLLAGVLVGICILEFFE